MTRVLLLVFMMSGAAGLFYESVWSRYLSLFVGHSAYAQVITLVLFLGGMSLGALLVSARTTRIRDPLYAYALVELVVGLIGMFFHDGLYLPVTNWAYDSVFPTLAGGTTLTVVKWSIAGALILPQSILLGATFPLMSAGVLRRAPAEPGRVLGSLYFANSFGAAIGGLVAGFVLFKAVGLPGTLQAAAMVNLVVALVCIVLSRLRPIETAPRAQADAAPVQMGSGPAVPITGRKLMVLLLAISAGTAVASFIYEIAWIRMLSLVIGSATHSFELMLSAFILGLALGALWVRRRADRFKHPLQTLAVVQLWMGALALLSLVLYSGAFSWAGTLLAAVARSDEGYVLFAIAKYAICLAIMLPATFCAGITLPLITRILLAEGRGEKTIGTVYGVNTFGSIVGIALAGLVLLPLLGLKFLLILGGVLDMALGVAILVVLAGARPSRGRYRLALAGLAITVVVTLAVGLGTTLDPGRMASAVFRQGLAALDRERIMLYQADGRTATVHGFQSGQGGSKVISTNGKPDGSLGPIWFTACTPGAAREPITGDDVTQMLLGVIPMAFRPQARSAAVIGHGTGMTSHFMLANSALESLTTIEIEPRMVDGSRVFEPANRRVFEDPRSHHVFDDAKSHFAAAGERYDIILSEPSNPWVSGVSGLFTEEFYARVKPFVAPGGIFGQWLHAYELSDGLVLSVLAALDRQFADYRIYAVSTHDLLVVATPEGRVPEPDWAVLRLPALEADLCHFHPLRAADMEAALVADKGGLGPMLRGANAPNSDFYPVLDLGAERARFVQRSASGVMALDGGVIPMGLANGGPVLGPDTTIVTAMAGVTGPLDRVVAAWLRRFAWGPESTAPSPVPWDEAVRYRHLGFRQGLALGTPPSSWGEWTLAFATISEELHAGTRRWTDELFFARIETFLESARAPQEPRAAVAFLRAMAGGDLSGAVEPARLLVEAARGGDFWIPVDDLMDGAVLALLAAGVPEEARAAFNMLRARSARSPDNARTLMLATSLRATVPDTLR